MGSPARNLVLVVKPRDQVFACGGLGHHAGQIEVVVGDVGDDDAAGIEPRQIDAQRLRVSR